MASEVFIPLTVGGGVRNTDNIRDLLLAGADKVSINTAAVFQPEFVKKAADKFGSQCIVVAIDAKRLSLVCGRSSHMADASQLDSTRSSGRREWSLMVRAKFC